MGRKKEITSEELINKWLNKIKKSVKASTYSTYTQLINRHILPYFKDKAVNQESVNKFIEYKKKAGYKATTINNIVVVLNSILKVGNKDIKAKKIKQPKTKTRILTDFERERLERYLLENLNFFNFGLLLMLYTGLRVGELSALQISDINTQAGIVSITKTLERIKNTAPNAKTKTIIVIDTPKSPSSIREIAVIDFLIEIYKKLYKGHTSGFLLTGTSRYVEPHQIDRQFKKILQDCHVPSINIHSLRHTFATEFYRQTKDIKTLSQILGHSSEVITIRLYVHSDLNEQKKGIEKMAQKRKTA